ncbi:Putative transport protein YhhT [Burkholderiaceae bacterium]|nr:Putative transport protein YhhT [Burkholderiaceae bacterium]
MSTPQQGEPHGPTAPPPPPPAPPPAPTPPREPPAPEQRTLDAPVDVRSVSLAVLAVLGTIFALHWASAVLIPVMVGVMFSYALSPIVERLVRWRVPRAISAAILIVGLLGGAVGIVYSLADDANELIESLPKATQKLRQAMRSRDRAPSPIDQVQMAATQLEQAAEETGPRAAGPRGATRVVIEKPRFNIKDYLWTGTLGLLALVGQVVVVSFLVFFILASGDSFRRKMVALAGPTFAQKKITVQVLDEITQQIERYLLVQIFTSTLVGLVTWLVFMWMGVEHAAVWGVLAGVLNFVPYIGAVLVTGGAALVGFLQFGNVEMAMGIGGASLVIQTLEGYLLTPWLTSRASRMSPVVIFVGVLAWGWLWGGWGLILGVPILMTMKAVCDRVEDLKPIGELLGD